MKAYLILMTAIAVAASACWQFASGYHAAGNSTDMLSVLSFFSMIFLALLIQGQADAADE